MKLGRNSSGARKKKNPSESGVLPGKQNENIQGKEMYGIGHSVSKMVNHCPKLENEEKERKEALRSGESNGTLDWKI